MKRSEAESVVCVALLYHRGIICPTEAWQTIAATNHDVVGSLESLNQSEQDIVRRIHKERPESLHGLAHSEQCDGQFSALFAWCLQHKEPRSAPRLTSG